MEVAAKSEARLMLGQSQKKGKGLFNIYKDTGPVFIMCYLKKLAVPFYFLLKIPSPVTSAEKKVHAPFAGKLSWATRCSLFYSGLSIES